jgi:glyoxylase-like metal-dependent hydrolase (beta-lactamase superfamily II)
VAITWRMNDITFHILTDGTFKGDAGVFFGVVPRAAWIRKRPVDADNCFDVPVRPVLAEVGGKRILVETGMGSKFERGGRFAREWGIEQPVTLLDDLATVGVQPGDIDLVVLTHLHFDHAGGNTRADGAGRLVPVYPRARYVVQRREYAEARYPLFLSRDTYLAENVTPVEEAGLWDLVDGDTEILPGVSLIVSPGHVPALQVVRFESGGEVAVVASDLIPSAQHMRLAWNTAWDIAPHTNALTKQRTIAAAARGGWHVFLYHDPDLVMGRVDSAGTLQPVLRPAAA